MTVPGPFEELHRRALERAKAMTLEERLEVLKRAGILDEDGHLAERYHPPPKEEMTDSEKFKDFIKKLENLTKETGIAVTGCGCCNSPFLVKVLDGYYAFDDEEYDSIKWKERK